jgi:hypothetical protein
MADISVELTVSLETPIGSEQEARFQVRTPEGQIFGEPAWVRLTVGGSSNCTSDSDFVEDVTIPDDSPIVAGDTFIKTWRIRNSGTCTWDNTYELVQIGGNSIRPTIGTDPVLLTDLIDEVSTVKPGAEVDISLELTLSAEAPVDSRQEARFHIRDANGEFFGTQPFVLVTVAAPE